MSCIYRCNLIHHEIFIHDFCLNTSQVAHTGWLEHRQGVQLGLVSFHSLIRGKGKGDQGLQESEAFCV